MYIIYYILPVIVNSFLLELLTRHFFFKNEFSRKTLKKNLSLYKWGKNKNIGKPCAGFKFNTSYKTKIFCAPPIFNTTSRHWLNMIWLKSQNASSRCRGHRGDEFKERWNAWWGIKLCPIHEVFESLWIFFIKEHYILFPLLISHT